jgi:translation initiation factor 4A
MSDNKEDVKEDVKEETKKDNYKINRSYNNNKINNGSNTSTINNEGSNTNNQNNRRNNRQYNNRQQNNEHYGNNGNSGYDDNNVNTNNGYTRNYGNNSHNNQDNGGYNNRYNNRQNYGNHSYNNQDNGGYNNKYNNNRQNNRHNKHYNNNNNSNDQNTKQQENTEEYQQQLKKDDKVSNDKVSNDKIINDKVVEDNNSMTPENILKREQCMVPLETFDDLAELIDLKIIRGVISYGFENPSPIQQKAIKPFLSKFDLIAQAQSGTGKTATFCIGTLGRIDFTKNEVQAIVLAHTLELAQQIEHVFSNIGKYTDLRLASAVKTTTVRENIDLLLGRNSPDALVPHVVIGTPGRILDMIMKGAIDVDTLRVLVLDEADELLSEGFIVQIKNIIGSITDKTQIGLFSATMDTNFFKLTEKFLRNPINILIKKENLTLEGIKQFYIDCEKNDFKFETLCDLYSLFSTCQTIIYCNYHQSVEILAKKMQEQDFKVSYIHGSMNIAEREDAMKKFRNLTTRVLISTDLLGRGIDVQQVSIVINYDIPFKSEAYIHRIGRSGRHGRTGTAINFTTNNDIKRMNDIEKYYETRILPLPVDMASVFQSNF